MQTKNILIAALISLSLIQYSAALIDLSNAKANSVIVQSNGQIVIAGSANIGGVNQGIIVRYNSNGTLDNTFGTNGVVTQVVGDNATFNVVFQQSNGQLVVGGSAGLTDNPQMIVLRYNTNGSLDTTFGTQGIFSTTLTATASVVNAIAQQSNGQLILVGTADSISFTHRLFVARLNGNGTFDSTFGNNGVTITTYGNYAVGSSVAIQTDGKIVIGGSNSIAFLCARYTTAGVLDTTFGNSGIATNNFAGTQAQCNSIIIQSNGNIVLGGWTDNNFATIRLTTAGQLDSTWGTSGRQITSFTSPAAIYDLVLQSDGNIVAVGYADSQIALARYLSSNGALDTSYGTNGQVTTQVGSMARALSAAYESSDGKVIIAGYSSPNLIVSRYNTDGTVDNTFGVVSSPQVCGTALCAYGQIYNVSQIDPLNNQPFTFDSNGIMLNVSHTAGSSNITIGLDGTYLVEYIINANSPASIQLQQNGTPVACASYITQSGTTVGSAIITAQNGDVITLINLSNYDIYLVGGAVNANVTLAKIA